MTDSWIRALVNKAFIPSGGRKIRQRPLLKCSAVCSEPQSQLSLLDNPGAARLRQIYQPQSVVCFSQVHARLSPPCVCPMLQCLLWISLMTHISCTSSFIDTNIHKFRIDIVEQLSNLVVYVDRLRRMLVIDPSSDTYYRWLFVISIAVLYNVLMIIARSVFWKLHDGNLLAIWLFFDYICDFIYLLDMAVQFRTGE